MKTDHTVNDYNIYIIKPNEKSFYFPYILCVPTKLQDGDMLFVETNNEENSTELNNSAKWTTNNILSMMNGSPNKSPIFIPILPTNGIDGRPYFQQLSHDCFKDDLPAEQQRIDLQLVNAIEDAKHKVFEITGKKLDNKIFMHGYSASGVFAQRFAIAHPEIISGLCVGGAIGSIPMPLSEFNGCTLNYPVGINDYEDIFDKPFNKEAYKRINFRYYVAEKEADRLSQTRFKEDGTSAPMHDMSYMDRSMPSEVGQNLRSAFGIDMNERCRNQLSIYKQMGIDVSAHEPYKDIMHNEIKNLAFRYIDDCLRECVQDREHE